MKNMKRTLRLSLTSLALAVALGAAGYSQAQRHDERPHGITKPASAASKDKGAAPALAAGGSVQAQSKLLPGTPVQAGPVDRTIAIDSGTRWVNVKHNETVQFVVKDASGDQSFAFRFDALDSRYPAKLSEIAPKALSVKDVIVFVDHSTNPATEGGQLNR